MRCLALSAILLTALLSFATASPAAAATCKCKTNYHPFGAPWVNHPRDWTWECVRNIGTFPPNTRPTPLPCNGQTKRGPA
ncbi:MAG TPA: hypothetical protein VN814_05680 [Caulobacteraceae bacterium]|nr:hypothetical protein [Caulobacteraceae bacterium]